jgi:hypothetical protein
LYAAAVGRPPDASGPDRGRTRREEHRISLPGAAGSKRAAILSCAAALLNARLAAGHAGAGLDVVALSEGDDSDLLARARLDGDGAADEPLLAELGDLLTTACPPA